MTYIDIINSVLRRLREATVATASESEYSQLISEFVLSTKREVESSWDWTALRQVIPVTTVQGVSSYTLTGAGKRFNTDEVYNTTVKQYLRSISPIIGRVDILDANQGQPTAYFYDGIDIVTGDLKVSFSPVPDGVHIVNFNVIVPQTDLPADDAEILMDEWPVILGAWSKAIEERGEDSGKAAAKAEDQYRLALGDAIAIDFARHPTEQAWNV